MCKKQLQHVCVWPFASFCYFSEGVSGGMARGGRLALLFSVEVAETALLRLRGGFIPLKGYRHSSSCSVKWPAHWSKVVEVSLLWGWWGQWCGLHVQRWWRWWGWRGWQCVWALGEGIWGVVGRYVALQLCVCLSMSEWRGREGGEWFRFRSVEA